VLALLMALWVNERLAGRGFLRMAYFTPTVLPMIAVANIWLFFYTPDYGLIDQIARAVRRPPTGSAPGHRARRADRHDGLEGSRLLHDLLPGGAAADPAEPVRGRGARGRVALVLLPPRDLPAADADHALRAGQRGHQRLPPGRPHHRDDQGRPGQRDSLLLFYIYEVGFKFWDTGYGAALTMVLLALLALLALGQYFFLEKRVHYR
jgi:sn-glycerol 3-phosphate transport system permease protein